MMWQLIIIINDIPGLGNIFFLSVFENIFPKIHVLHHPHRNDALPKHSPKFYVV